MSYAIRYDRAAWYPVPAQFPTAEWRDVASWRACLVDEFELDMGPLSDDARAAVGELADRAAAARSPLASEVLLFCPRRMLTFGTVSVFVGSLADVSQSTGGTGVDAVEDLVSGIDSLLPATIEPFSTAALGSGLRAAIVLETADGTIAGGFAYAFDVAGTVVFVLGAADGLYEATMMLEFLEELVDGIRLEPIGTAVDLSTAVARSPA